LSLWNKDQSKENYKGKHYINYWLGNNQEFYIARSSRDLKRIDIVSRLLVDKKRVLVEERMNVYQDIQKPKLITGGRQFIHCSQRDGWGHYYLYDISGKLVQQITKGEFHCNDLSAYHESTGTLFFQANGNEKDIDPYY